MPGRTQHNVKNRFFVLIGAELQLSLQKTKEVLTEKNIKEFVQKALDLLDENKNLETKENSMNDDDSPQESSSDNSFDNAVEYLFKTKKNDRNEDFLFELNQPFL